MACRLAEGRTKKEVIRCLKRYIIRDIFRTLRVDLATLQTRLDPLWGDSKDYPMLDQCSPEVQRDQIEREHR